MDPEPEPEPIRNRNAWPDHYRMRFSDPHKRVLVDRLPRC